MCWNMRLGVGGNTNFPEVLLKAVQDPFDSRIQSVVTFPRMRTFCMSLLLFLPLLPRDIVSSSLRELWASISLGVFLLPVVPSSVALDLGFHLNRSIFLHPLLGMWGHQTLMKTHSILQYLLCF